METQTTYGQEEEFTLPTKGFKYFRDKLQLFAKKKEISYS
jgi:hypothetical protein